MAVALATMSACEVADCAALKLGTMGVFMAEAQLPPVTNGERMLAPSVALCPSTVVLWMLVLTSLARGNGRGVRRPLPEDAGWLTPN